MEFLDLKKQAVLDTKQGRVISYLLEVNLDLGWTETMVSISNYLLDKLESEHFNTVPVLFDFIIIANEKLDEDSFETLVNMILSCLFVWNMGDKKYRSNLTPGDIRLDAPVELVNKVNLTKGWLKDLINYQCEFNRFSVCISDDGSDLHYVLINNDGKRKENK